MKCKDWTRVLAFGLLAGVVGAGCSSEEGGPTGNSTGSPEQQTADLDDPHGGYLAVDEEPAFGDDALAASALDEVAIEDGYADLDPNERARARSIEQQRRARFSLTVLWGTLDATSKQDTVPNPNELSDVVNWTGSMWIDSGAVCAHGSIGFEPGEDTLIRPRASAASLEWISYTQGDYDGLRVSLVFPELPEATPDEAVHFKAGPLGEVSFLLSELEGLSVVLDVPGSTEQVSFTALRIDPLNETRAGGFVTGRWSWADGDSTGHFRGRWISHAGVHQGYLAGVYGLDSTGQQVFYGKTIGLNGRFQGFLEGTYTVLRQQETTGPAGAPVAFEVGGFEGRWESASGERLGDVHGSWSRVGERPGVFSGHWRGMGITP